MFAPNTANSAWRSHCSSPWFLCRQNGNSHAAERLGGKQQHASHVGRLWMKWYSEVTRREALAKMYYVWNGLKIKTLSRGKQPTFGYMVKCGKFERTNIIDERSVVVHWWWRRVVSGRCEDCMESQCFMCQLNIVHENRRSIGDCVCVATRDIGNEIGVLGLGEGGGGWMWFKEEDEMRLHLWCLGISVTYQWWGAYCCSMKI